MLILGSSVVIAHSAIGEGHLGDGMMMCMAIMSVASAVLLLRAAGRTRLLAPLLTLVPAVPHVSLPVPELLPRARAGPAVLQVFLR